MNYQKKLNRRAQRQLATWLGWREGAEVKYEAIRDPVDRGYYRVITIDHADNGGLRVWLLIEPPYSRPVAVATVAAAVRHAREEAIADPTRGKSIHTCLWQTPGEESVTLDEGEDFWVARDAVGDSIIVAFCPYCGQKLD